MDFRNIGDATDPHTILYGHNTKYKTMFANLLKYKNKEFFDSYNIIEFNTLNEDLTYEIFAAYTTSIDFYFIVTKFKTDKEYLSFIKTLQSKSIHKTNIVLNEFDNILTLSTCTVDGKDYRFVVHARKINF